MRSNPVQFIGFSYAPRIKNLKKQSLYPFKGHKLSLAALAAQIPAYLIETAYFRPVSFAWSSIAVFIYMGIFASVLAYGLWNAGVTVVGANQAVFTVPLLPAFAAILAILLLGEEPRLYHLAAAALILGGVYLSAIHKHLFKAQRSR